ncbi:MAG: tellurite resistance TerB family protein [Cyanobacteriota bacterium]|jgi:hypothetical protein
MTPAEAFAAIALAAIACDGVVDPHEAAILRAQLDGRHPYVDLGQERMGHLFEGLLQLLHDQGWRELIARAIPTLSPSQRETALAMAAHLVHCDRAVNAVENGLLQEMAARMSLPEGRADQILEVITVLHRDSLAT